MALPGCLFLDRMDRSDRIRLCSIGGEPPTGLWGWPSWMFSISISGYQQSRLIRVKVMKEMRRPAHCIVLAGLLLIGMANTVICQETSGRSGVTKLKVGIFGFGSLIADPGEELANATASRMEAETPFAVEYGRTSKKTRGGAPTLVPVKT